MKHLFALLFLISFNCISANYDGAWYFIKGQYTLGNGEIIYADNNTVVAIKTVKGNKFALTNMKAGTFSGYLAGDFTTDEQHYSEVITSGTSDEHLGKTFTFKGWLETKEIDSVKTVFWHHQGEVNGVLETEVWRKIKP